MGCDIHGWVEVRGLHGGVPDEWIGILDIDDLIERSYRHFYRLFGVRKREEASTPLCPDRGYPSDVSDRVMKESIEWGSDAHSPSYITLSELKEYPMDLQDDLDWITLKNLMIEFSRYVGGVEKVRLVVWFDN